VNGVPKFSPRQMIVAIDERALSDVLENCYEDTFKSPG